MKKIVSLALLLLLSFTLISLPAFAESGVYKPNCDTSKTTVCTIELWLAHKHKRKTVRFENF